MMSTRSDVSILNFPPISSGGAFCERGAFFCRMDRDSVHPAPDGPSFPWNLSPSRGQRMRRFQSIWQPDGPSFSRMDRVSPDGPSSGWTETAKTERNRWKITKKVIDFLGKYRKYIDFSCSSWTHLKIQQNPKFVEMLPDGPRFSQSDWHCTNLKMWKSKERLWNALELMGLWKCHLWILLIL